MVTCTSPALRTQQAESSAEHGSQELMSSRQVKPWVHLRTDTLPGWFLSWAFWMLCHTTPGHATVAMNFTQTKVLI